jgi:putative membrane protein
MGQEDQEYGGITRQEVTVMVERPDRNTLALDRTVLANERTYAAWMRTGLALLATGLGVARFMLDTIPFWSIRLITVILFCVSAASFLLAGWRYNHLHVKFSHLDVKMIPTRLVQLITLVLSLSALVAMVVIWRISE